VEEDEKGIRHSEDIKEVGARKKIIIY